MATEVAKSLSEYGGSRTASCYWKSSNVLIDILPIPLMVSLSNVACVFKILLNLNDRIHDYFRNGLLDYSMGKRK